MLALANIQEAIVDDKKNPSKHNMLDSEDYEQPTRRLMLKCKKIMPNGRKMNLDHSIYAKSYQRHRPVHP